ncbi:molybdate ABC transporter ATP-binding protein ModF [Avibacterium gallinarum]|uniref:molybdate ABC transporter ATP-binding protein ModF n=1 Tax=Avibacterium gallinarum TaxID=755 RepID=UPI0039FD1FC2
MIKIENAIFQLAHHQRLKIDELSIHPNDYWGVVGSNGSGKTALALALEGKLPLLEGSMENHFQTICSLSFEKQQNIFNETFKHRNNDGVSPDDFGKTAKQTILAEQGNLALFEEYLSLLKITALLDRPFIQLSTGESRKVLLCQALVQQPDLLILDEPFEGLDQQSVKEWKALLAQLQQKMAILLILNRFEDIPDEANHLALLEHQEVIFQGERQAIEQQSLYQQLHYAESAQHIPLPERAVPEIKLDENQPLFELEQVTIQYDEKKILDKLDWQVKRGENWWIKGPNGAGKSTLLSVISGDHPQSYANKVRLFGNQRGSGETIWQIKQKIGYVSSQLHMDYRVNCSARDVILSGFFDSIGVYQKVPDALHIKAMEWLARLNLTAQANQPFKSLSWGQQRLLLITRAMVKHPPVLILDEPLQGLDGVNRKLVKGFIDQLVMNSETQLLFVSHQDQDAPSCITHLFEFVNENGHYRYVQKPI